ncbi:MAG: hypothetical protein ACD_62C00417G0012 [uncultured bacterium]|nr:MAG: hypothetical protein ACD_62C00417G0012 [uncultured bacterium]HLD45230.1 30S ribosomal protein S17 [bacterium]
MNKNKKTLEGIVIRNKMIKTVIVEIKSQFKHPVVHKIVTTTKKFKAHDQNSECGLGDRVVIRECKPISKEKRWVVAKILEKAAS